MKYVEPEDQSQEKYYDKAYIEIHIRRRDIKQIQYSYQSILLQIQVRNIYLQLLIISVSLYMQV